MHSQSRVLDYKQQGGLRTPHSLMWSIDTGLKGDCKDTRDTRMGRFVGEVSNGLELKDFRLSTCQTKLENNPAICTA